MHRKHLLGFSMLLLLGGCAHYQLQTGEAQPAGPDGESNGEAAVDGHNSRNSLDWAGTYSGILPCADCPGIETVVTLSSDGTYQRSMFYLEEAVSPLVDNGSFSWDESGNRIALDIGSDQVEQYQVEENQLSRLDIEGQRITGNLASYYVLAKHLNDPAIEDRRWRLVELRGQPVESTRGAALMLQAEGSVASGNASCNSFSGSYAIKGGQRISFGRHMTSTMMACPDMSIESAFFEVLRMVDNYSVGDDMLSLNRARMAPLARFERVEE